MNIFLKLSYTIDMKTIDTPARKRARTKYEKSTDNKVVPVRLGNEARERLERLAVRYGGRKEAIEVALIALERSTSAYPPLL